MAMDRSIITKIVDDKVNSMCNVSEWYNYPFVTDVDLSKIEHDGLSERELDVCRYDFVAEIIQEVMNHVFNTIEQPLNSSNPNLEFIHDVVREEIINLIS